MTRESVTKASGIIDEIERLKADIYCCKLILENDEPIHIQNEEVGWINLNLEFFGGAAKEVIVRAAIGFLNAEIKNLEKQLQELPADLPDKET